MCNKTVQNNHMHDARHYLRRMYIIQRSMMSEDDVFPSGDCAGNVELIDT